MCSANRLVRLYAPCGAVPSHNNLQGFYRAPRTLRVAPIAFKKERNTKGSHELANISEQISQSLKSPRGVVLWTIAVGTCVRLLCAAYAIDLTYGEAYYVASARHFALSYFDHPPLTFWLVGATMKLTGSDALIILRTPFILLFAATTWLMYRLGSSLFGGWEGALSALLLNITPLYAISIGAWVEPDGPLMFCSLAATLCIVSLAFKRKPSAEVLLWVQAGLWLGLAMLCKYYAVLLPAGIFLFALTNREHREWFRKPGPYLACAIAVVMFSPVLIWNFEHHWISFNFQGERADITGIDIKALITNILGQAVFIGPWIWIPMLLACRRPLQAGTTNLSSWFLLCLGLVPILFFTTIPLLTRTHGHYYWQALGYLFLFPLLARHVIERLQVRHASTVTWLSLSAVAPFLIIAVIGVEAATGWAYTSLKNFHLKRDVTLEGLEWKELRAAIAQRQLLNRSRLFVATAHRLEVGKVDLEIGKFLPVVCMCEDPRDIAFGWNLSSFSGWDALIIGTEFYIPDVQHTYGDYFQDIERLNDVLIHRGGQVVVTLRVYYAKQYSGSYPLPVPTARSLK